MATTPPRPRLDAIDQLRGLVMVLMALDHARNYFAPFPHAPDDLSQASPALFLTRWITHFCAPVFVFLAGTSIYLKQSRDTPRAGASPPRSPEIPHNSARAGASPPRSSGQAHADARAGASPPRSPDIPHNSTRAEASPPRSPEIPRNSKRAGASPPRSVTSDAPATTSPTPPPSLSRYLITRGLWLILLELTIIGASWGFAFVGILCFQVIWVLGISMIIMALLVRLPWQVSFVFGLTTVGLHNLLDPIQTATFAEASRSLAPAWRILHEQGFIPFTNAQSWPQPGIFVIYPLIPWPGVMALGYCFGKVATMPAAARLKWTATLGTACILAFLLLRAALTYGDPRPIDANPPDHPILALLNTTKYPPSLQFLLMTLGPALLALVALERHRGPIADTLRTFGRVPLFFYLLHIPLTHIPSAIIWFALLGATSGWQIAPPFPDAYTPQLWVAYAAWVAVVATLWWPCRWYERLRTRHRAWWTTYL